MDFYKLLLLFSCGAVCLCGPVQNDKQNGGDNVKMINPNYSNITDYPFNVAVLSGMSLLGGGTLINQRWVISSAAVAQRFDLSVGLIRVASNSAYDGGRLHKVIQVIPHPQYASNRTYNVALFKLDTPVYPKVALAMAGIATAPFGDDGITANVTGFGTGAGGKVEKPFLQIVSTTVHDFAWCNSNAPMQICSYIGYQGAPCYGDGGDPLFWCVDRFRCILLGVNTGDPKCTSAYLPTLGDGGDPLFWCVDRFRCILLGVNTGDPKCTSAYFTFTDVGRVAKWIYSNINNSTATDN